MPLPEILAYIFSGNHILTPVMKMKNSKEILSAVLKTTQREQAGIRSVLRSHMGPQLRMALESQLREYDVIEQEIFSVAGQRGWELKELDPALRFLSGQTLRGMGGRTNRDSKVADRMIRRTTKGLILNLQNLHQYPRQDDRISTISQKLADCETAGIRNLQRFL